MVNEDLVLVAQTLNDRGEYALAELIYREAATKGLARLRKRIKVLHMMYQKAKKRAVAAEGDKKKSLWKKAKRFLEEMKKQMKRAKSLAKRFKRQKKKPGSRSKKHKEILEKAERATKEHDKKLKQIIKDVEEKVKNIKRKGKGKKRGKGGKKPDLQF